MIEKGYLTTKEAATFLNISENTLRDLVKKGEVVAYKKSRKLMFKQYDLIKWVEK